MLGRSSDNHDWLRLRFLRFSFTQRTQRKRLRLNENRAVVKPITTTTATANATIYKNFINTAK